MGSTGRRRKTESVGVEVKFVRVTLKNLQNSSHLKSINRRFNNYRIHQNVCFGTIENLHQGRG